MNIPNSVIPKRIGILGSTGSIGTQALEVISQFPEHFEIAFLTAHSNVLLLVEQALKFKPASVVLTDTLNYNQLKSALTGENIQVLAGVEALNDLVREPDYDLLLTAIVGAAGLLPTWYAIESGHHIALANKETLVVAGELMMSLAQKNQVQLLPVDSEHSAIFQCLIGEEADAVNRLILTASGGPFRGYTMAELTKVTFSQALKHPNWSMGAKITIDSATLCNKGLELIEARWLFGTEAIDIIVHPQSIIHSMVEFKDGSIKAQMGLPDMKTPILYAIAYPKRMATATPFFNFMDFSVLTFEQPDTDVFRSIPFARYALEKKGNTACIFNAANEIGVAKFLKGEITFPDIYACIEFAYQEITYMPSPTIIELLETDKATRELLTSK